MTRITQTLTPLLLVLCCLRSELALTAEVNYASAVADAIKAGHLAEARQLCDRWVGAEPDNEQPRLILGRALLKSGMIDEALEQFELAAVANPSSTAPRCEVGLLLLNAGDPDLAASEFEEALRIDPDYLPAMLGQITIRLLKEDITGARAVAKRAFESRPDNAQRRCEVGLFLVHGDRPDLARWAFEEALKVDPGYVPAMLGRVKVKLLRDGAEAALVDAKRVMESHPDSASARAMVSDCLFALGKVSEALVASRRAFELEPRNADVLFGLARACQTIGEEAESQQHWRWFLEVEPSGNRADAVRNGWTVLHTREVAEKQGWQGGGVTWSPDGRRLAFVASQQALVVLPLSKPHAGQREIATTTAKYLSPRWSPDGAHVAMLESIGVHQWSAAITPADGSGQPRQLLPAWGVTWSPIEEGVLYCNAYRPSEIFRGMTVDGKLIDGLERPGAFTDVQGARWGLSLPDFAPDGQRVVFVGFKWAGTQSRRLFVFSGESWSQRTELTRGDQWSLAPRFSPDGRSVAYLSLAGSGYDLWVVAADGSAGPALLAGFSDHFPVEPVPEWSPDGREIAYGTHQGITISRLGGLDRSPVGISANGVGHRLTVALRNRVEKPVVFDAAYELFGPNSIRIARGPVGEKGMQLNSGGVIECQVDVHAPEQPGDCVVKITAVTTEGEKAIKLIRLPLPE